MLLSFETTRTAHRVIASWRCIHGCMGGGLLDSRYAFNPHPARTVVNVPRRRSRSMGVVYSTRHYWPTRWLMRSPMAPRSRDYWLTGGRRIA